MKSAILTRSIILVLSLCSCGIPKADEMNLESVNLIENIFINKPVDVSVETRFPVEDFMLAEFETSGDVFMRAYVGNAPQFPSDSCVGSAEEISINGLSGKRVNCSNDEIFCEALVDVGAKGSWPRFIHFTLLKSESYQPIGMRIIESISVKR